MLRRDLLRAVALAVPAGLLFSMPAVSLKEYFKITQAEVELPWLNPVGSIATLSGSQAFTVIINGMPITCKYVEIRKEQDSWTILSIRY